MGTLPPFIPQPHIPQHFKKVDKKEGGGGQKKEGKLALLISYCMTKKSCSFLYNDIKFGPDFKGIL